MRRDTYLGKSTWAPNGNPRRGMFTNVNLCKAAEAIEHVIAFMKMLPKTDNSANVKHRIWQWQSWLAKPLGTQSTSPAPLPPVSLPPPGVGAYRPPMLHEQPPHLDLVTGNLDSVTTHQNTTMVMSLLIRYTHIPFYFCFPFTFPTSPIHHYAPPLRRDHTHSHNNCTHSIGPISLI